MPKATVGLAGVTLIEVSVAAPMVSVVLPLTLPWLASTVTVPSDPPEELTIPVAELIVA